MITSTLEGGVQVLLVINGAYGHRQTAICKYAGIDYETLEFEALDKSFL